MKHFLQNQEFQLDEILFQKRNKSYGAYNLRHNSESILTKSMFVGVAFFGLLAATPLILNSFKEAPPKITFDNSGEHILDKIPETPEIKKPEVVVPPKAVATVNTQVPTPVNKPIKDDPPAKVSELDKAVGGFENVKGDPPIVQFQPPANIPTTGGGGEKVVIDPPKKVVDNTIKTRVDVEANFEDGIKAFRNKVVQNFDTSYFDGLGDKVTTTITFVVEKDGSISEVKSNGNNTEFNKEAEKTIRKIKGKWIPAKIDGEPVRSYFKFPISMMFE